MAPHPIHSAISKSTTKGASAQQRPKADPTFVRMLATNMPNKAKMGHPSVSSNSSAAQKHLVFIGRISKQNPTVSNLLIKSSTYRKDCWKIVHADVNQNKPFTKMQAGDRIYLDPQTYEIVHTPKIAATKVPPATKLAQHQTALTSYKRDYSEYRFSMNHSIAKHTPPRQPATPKSLANRLVDSVKNYLGRSYGEIDCYELLVKGLQKIGIRYRGKGGLQEQLLFKAKSEGRPLNAYLTGEGIIEASGSKIYARTMTNIRHPHAQAQQSLRELQPFLAEGHILSFSTPSRGHTGIVSQRKGLWTFINSGRQDNPVGPRRASKGVGEEILTAEIKTWFKRAAEKKEPLQITLGRLSEARLAAFKKTRQQDPIA